MSENLSERDRRVLQAIIMDYIQTAEPVGSRVVSKKYRMDLSPATIRNVMGDLEEMGFLTQPHTSAGRIPTDTAFRYYVDSILEVGKLRQRDQERIDSLQEEELDTQEVMKRASSLLSTLSKQAGVVLAPRFGSSIFKHVEFIQLREKKILVILVSKTGEVQNRLIESDEQMSQNELDKYSRYLTEITGGLTLAQAKRRIFEEMQKVKVLFDKLMYRALQLSQMALEDEGEGDIFIEGRTNIIRSPEFAGMEKMQNILRAFEEKTKIIRLLDKALSTHGIQIFIGAENDFNDLKACSIVAASYAKENFTLGTLGVIGPTRMDYSNIIPIVEYTASLVSKVMENLDRS